MTRRTEYGVTYAHAFDGSSYCFDRSCYADLLKAWKAGAAFFDGVGMYGQPVSVKLARIEGVSDFSPDAIAAFDADEREGQKQAMLGA